MPAGNNWVTLPGASTETVIIGGHLDSVPNGGWLDGCLGVLAGLEALRLLRRARRRRSRCRWSTGPTRKARGSAAACSDRRPPAGSLKIDDVRELTDKQGTRLVDALRENGVALDRMLDAHRELKTIDAARLPRAAHRAGPGARVDAQADRRRARHLRRRAPHAALRRARRRTPGRRRSRCGATRFSPRRRPRSTCREIARRHSTPDAGASCARSASSRSSRGS